MEYKIEVEQMKEKRHNTILNIIDTMDIETQKDLADQLLERGYRVTQATISRDIKELHLIKVQGESGIYKYTVNEAGSVPNTEKLLRVLRDMVVDIKSAGNLVVVSTLSGSANAAGEIIDNLGIDDIIGSIAGDNTIFIAAADGTVEKVSGELRGMLK